MDRTDLLAFLRAQKWAVQASVTRDGAPQAAVIGVAIGDDLEIVFDTLSDSRKAENLRRDPRIALVIGWDDAVTAQIEGIADEPEGAERERVQALYFKRFPDGVERAAWPNITYFRVRPKWIRVTDFRAEEAVITFVPVR